MKGPRNYLVTKGEWLAPKEPGYAKGYPLPTQRPMRGDDSSIPEDVFFEVDDGMPTTNVILAESKAVVPFHRRTFMKWPKERMTNTTHAESSSSTSQMLLIFLIFFILFMIVGAVAHTVK